MKREKCLQIAKMWALADAAIFPILCGFRKFPTFYLISASNIFNCNLNNPKLGEMEAHH